MAYRNVCRRGQPGGGRVRQDDPAIIWDIIATFSAEDQRKFNQLFRSNRDQFNYQMKQYRSTHQQQVRALIPNHDAGAASPGILWFINQVVFNLYSPTSPPRPPGFRSVNVQTYPGRRNVDTHFEGRAADIFFNYTNPETRIFGDWLFDFCYENCQRYQIQGVIFGDRRWFSETMNGAITRQVQHDHYNHVHVELNYEGANRTSQS